MKTHYLPFLFLPLMFVPRRLFFLVVILSAVSVSQMLIVSASRILVPDNALWNIDKLGYLQYSSIYSYCLRQLVDGHFAWNLGTRLLGLKNWSSLGPIIVAIVGVAVIFSLKSLTRCSLNLCKSKDDGLPKS